MKRSLIYFLLLSIIPVFALGASGAPTKYQDYRVAAVASASPSPGNSPAVSPRAAPAAQKPKRRRAPNRRIMITQVDSSSDDDDNVINVAPKRPPLTFNVVVGIAIVGFAAYKLKQHYDQKNALKKAVTEEPEE